MSCHFYSFTMHSVYHHLCHLLPLLHLVNRLTCAVALTSPP
jgi:hypothetical protein